MIKRTNTRINIYIDASPMAENKITGIPLFTAELVKALDKHPDNGKKFNIILVIAFDKKIKLSRWNYLNVKIKAVPLPQRVLNLIWKYNLLPPMDIFLGKGYYIFPNYKNWPLHKSYSMTYIHDLGFIRYPEFVQPKNLEFLKSNIQLWIKRTNVILTGSDHARQEIIELLNVQPKKVVRIYHGVDHAQYYPRTQVEINAAKNKYDIKGKYILYVGSLEPRKNLKRLINAYCQLPKSLCSKYALCLVGAGGWLNDDILSTIDVAQKRGFNIIRPKKYVEGKDLPSIISGAILLAHPALYEGFGLTPLEAMACGTPTIVADNSSLPEVVSKASTMVDAQSEKDISAKIEKVLTDKKYYADIKKAGLIQAQKFTWEISAQELLNKLERTFN